MNDREILALYDHDERYQIEHPGARREDLGRVVRHVDLTGERGFVLYTQLDEASIDAAIEQQIAFFEGIGQDFEWKVFGHDRPADLRQRLMTRGFALDGDDAEALLILPLAEAPARLLEPVTHDIRRVTDPDAMMTMLAVQAEVWGEDYTSLGERLARDLREHPALLSVYAAYADDRPVSSAWLYTNPGSRFAGLWGGATLPAYRGRGIYTALVAVRAQEAIARGVQFLTIDASPMSRPIVQKLGFHFMTMTFPCVWHVEQRRQTR
jgi:GNAT superfamily N-acetyltransferase